MPRLKRKTIETKKEELLIHEPPIKKHCGEGNNAHPINCFDPNTLNQQPLFGFHNMTHDLLDPILAFFKSNSNDLWSFANVCQHWRALVSKNYEDSKSFTQVYASKSPTLGLSTQVLQYPPKSKNVPRNIVLFKHLKRSEIDGKQAQLFSNSWSNFKQPISNHRWIVLFRAAILAGESQSALNIFTRLDALRKLMSVNALNEVLPYVACLDDPRPCFESIVAEICTRTSREVEFCLLKANHIPFGLNYKVKGFLLMYRFLVWKKMLRKDDEQIRSDFINRVMNPSTEVNSRELLEFNQNKTGHFAWRWYSFPQLCAQMPSVMITSPHRLIIDSTFIINACLHWQLSGEITTTHLSHFFQSITDSAFSGKISWVLVQSMAMANMTRIMIDYHFLGVDDDNSGDSPASLDPLLLKDLLRISLINPYISLETLIKFLTHHRTKSDTYPLHCCSYIIQSACQFLQPPKDASKYRRRLAENRLNIHLPLIIEKLRFYLKQVAQQAAFKGKPLQDLCPTMDSLISVQLVAELMTEAGWFLLPETKLIKLLTPPFLSSLEAQWLIRPMHRIEYLTKLIQKSELVHVAKLVQEYPFAFLEPQTSSAASVDDTNPLILHHLIWLEVLKCHDIAAFDIFEAFAKPTVKLFGKLHSAVTDLTVEAILLGQVDRFHKLTAYKRSDVSELLRGVAAGYSNPPAFSIVLQNFRLFLQALNPSLRQIKVFKLSVSELLPRISFRNCNSDTHQCYELLTEIEYYIQKVHDDRIKNQAAWMEAYFKPKT